MTNEVERLHQRLLGARERQARKRDEEDAVRLRRWELKEQFLHNLRPLEGAPMKALDEDEGTPHRGPLSFKTGPYHVFLKAGPSGPCFLAVDFLPEGARIEGQTYALEEAIKLVCLALEEHWDE